MECRSGPVLHSADREELCFALEIPKRASEGEQDYVIINLFGLTSGKNLLSSLHLNFCYNSHRSYVLSVFLSVCSADSFIFRDM